MSDSPSSSAQSVSSQSVSSNTTPSSSGTSASSLGSLGGVSGHQSSSRSSSDRPTDDASGDGASGGDTNGVSAAHSPAAPDSAALDHVPDGLPRGFGEPAEAVGRPMNILLIEDSVLEARLAMGVLRKGNIEHRLNWLRNGTEGIAYLKQAGRFANAVRPDLVLLDLRLPGVDGCDVLRMVREDDKLAGLPVVVMTSSTDEEDTQITSQLNVQAYMTKPVDLEQFLTIVEELKGYWKADMLVPTRS